MLCHLMAITESSPIQFHVRLSRYFFISSLLGKCIASLKLSHLPPLSMTRNKTGTWEEILKVSFSRTLTLDRKVADRMGRAPPVLKRIQILWRQETGKHPRMKGDFNQARNCAFEETADSLDIIQLSETKEQPSL